MPGIGIRYSGYKGEQGGIRKVLDGKEELDREIKIENINQQFTQQMFYIKPHANVLYNPVR